MNELRIIKNQISNNKELSKIIKNTDTEAFIVDNVDLDNDGIPLIWENRKNFLIKL